MSSKFFICLFIVGFLYTANCAQWQIESYQHPDYPGQCYDKEINEPVPVGKTSNSLLGCKWQQCQPDFTFQVTNCAPTGLPREGCKVTEPDFSKRYPKCCPQMICENYN